MTTNHQEFRTPLEPEAIPYLPAGVHSIILPRMIAINSLPGNIVSQYSYQESPLPVEAIAEIIQKYTFFALKSGFNVISTLIVMATVETPTNNNIHPSRKDEEQRIIMTIAKGPLDPPRPGRKTTQG